MGSHYVALADLELVANQAGFKSTEIYLPLHSRAEIKGHYVTPSPKRHFLFFSHPQLDNPLSMSRLHSLTEYIPQAPLS